MLSVSNKSNVHVLEFPESSVTVSCIVVSELTVEPVTGNLSNS